MEEKELAMSWLPDILSPHHSKFPLMTVTSHLDPGHLWASFSLQWHFYGSSVIHLLIHSYTLHCHRVPGTRLGTEETMMSKTQPLALKEPWSSGGWEDCCHRQSTVLARGPPHQETLLQNEADASHCSSVSSLWPTVSPRAGLN